ncbi:NADPH:quinone reductase [Pedobacter steynii]|uniref:NADPH:quinone reductase n=1 Tax=Pedobacter steynii TaxID=430522 RepID=A0A1G9NSJ5_9SPHI|nr:zinc-binding alcohol dehydrogenase family protein [Pedobacter steynii]NQX39204.1 zinc-binding alcohol dehydrogenase family protein [Pedobacter steynii]SDL89360.1 NADPH:quinone reductase [Pedobacter steynii]
MKAAILNALGETPKYGEFTSPVPKNAGQLLVTVKAASVKNLDKAIASGAHYTSHAALFQPVVVGVDGVGILEDGSRVYAAGLQGMISEKALIDKNRFVRLPDHLDVVTAAALPNAVLGAAAALRYRAAVKPGDTVLINGATGVTGRIAVQIAKHYGAKKVIATGRNAASLESLKALGADEVISLKQGDEEILQTLREIHRNTPINSVIDYLWGHPAELILKALGGKGKFTHPLRFVTVGGMAGDQIQLSSGTLRSADITLIGSGIGSLSEELMQKLFKEVLPEMFLLAADGKLKIDTVTAPLKEIETAWNQDIDSGKRLVILM